jgi:hypothetical protein
MRASVCNQLGPEVNRGVERLLGPVASHTTGAERAAEARWSRRQIDASSESCCTRNQPVFYLQLESFFRGRRWQAD